MRAGGSEEMAWLQICEPTEKDKGKYTFEIFDGKENHQRSLDLSGAGESAPVRTSESALGDRFQCGEGDGLISRFSFRENYFRKVNLFVWLLVSFH